MTTYADPTRCPDCHTALPQSPDSCPRCALPLTGATVVSLFTTLQEADRLLARLRQEKSRVAAAVTVGAVATSPGPLLEGTAPYPVARRTEESTESPRVSGASVPRILLSLGALCLLIAAVTFLAVAWTWLGIGGRTVVLVALTAASFTAVGLLYQRGLRTGAEALSVVGLGLLALDIVGIRHAGWLGEIDDAHLTFLTGAVLAAGAVVVLLSTASRPLVAPALIAPLATLVAGAGWQWHVDSVAPTVVTTVAVLGLARVGTNLPSVTLVVTAIPSAAAAWVYVVVAGFQTATDPQTAAHIWGDAAGWPLVAAVVLAAAVGPVTGVQRMIGDAGYAVAGLLATYVIVLPILDNSRTASTTALLVASAVWVAGTVLAPRRLATLAAIPLLGSLVVPIVALLELLGESARATLQVAPAFSAGFDVHVDSSQPWVSPGLLLPTLVVAAAAGCAVVRLVSPVPRPTWFIALSAAALAGAITTVPLYDVPLAVVVGLLVLVAIAGLLAALRVPLPAAHVLPAVSLLLLVLATAAALPSDVLTSAVLAVATVAAALLMLRTDLTGDAAALAFPVAFGGLVWAMGHVIGVEPSVRAVPVLVVLGGLAIWRPREELEISSAVVATVVAAASVQMAADSQLALAIYLTLAGALVTGSSIINASRRILAWPGGLLLAAATWVRLAQIGVHAPEAYTLPSALVLVAVGVWRLRREDEAATLTFLAPGLTLATVPSLIATFDDPYSLRALLLGAACLGLVLAGVTLRWSAPLVVGACVGTVLVLRELAPYAAAVPTWVTIGLSGTVLTLVGITWESRMRDVRTASRYLASLR
jgi:hypothetical protein